MENNTVYQEKGRSWMVDVAFYLAAAVLLSLLFLYGIFSVKASLQIQKISRIDEKISVYGTQEQKQHEEKVYDYKKKIDDFALAIGEHAMSSNVFTFLEANTLPGVVFSTIATSLGSREVRLSGEAQDMAVLGWQFAKFENNKEYIRHINVLNSQIMPSGRLGFVFTLDVEPAFFEYGTPFSLDNSQSSATTP